MDKSKENICGTTSANEKTRDYHPLDFTLNDIREKAEGFLDPFLAETLHSFEKRFA